MDTPIKSEQTDNKNFVILLIAIIGALLILVVLLLFKGPSKNSLSEPSGQGISPTNSPEEQKKAASVIITDKAILPNIITGTITDITTDKLTISQFASYDLKYVINKNDLSNIISLKPNPQFDKDKFQTLQTNPPDDKTTVANNPALQRYLEVPASWEAITQDAQVSLQNDQNGIKKLVLLPKEVNIKPPQDK